MTSLAVATVQGHCRIFTVMGSSFAGKAQNLKPTASVAFCRSRANPLFTRGQGSAPSARERPALLEVCPQMSIRRRGSLPETPLRL
ncbi:uncharacterized protein LOC143683546 isoform X2 [Tamandua tetradactyla]|uniref:uncharacterized protein LOC143683546 isoform X2 n=1 Tax=Tamandua tetradactyla TaxID=48850 RepID=UPI0040540869